MGLSNYHCGLTWTRHDLPKNWQKFGNLVCSISMIFVSIVREAFMIYITSILQQKCVAKCCTLSQFDQSHSFRCVSKQFIWPLVFTIESRTAFLMNPFFFSTYHDGTQPYHRSISRKAHALKQFPSLAGQ